MQSSDKMARTPIAPAKALVAAAFAVCLAFGKNKYRSFGDIGNKFHHSLGIVLFARCEKTAVAHLYKAFFGHKRQHSTVCRKGACINVIFKNTVVHRCHSRVLQNGVFYLVFLLGDKITLLAADKIYVFHSLPFIVFFFNKAFIAGYGFAYIGPALVFIYLFALYKKLHLFNIVKFGKGVNYRIN